MLLWLKAADGSAINAEGIDAFTFEDFKVGEDAEKQPIMQLAVVAMMRGCKILMAPVKTQQEGIAFIASVTGYIKSEYDRQNGKVVQPSTPEEAEALGKQVEAQKKKIKLG